MHSDKDNIKIRTVGTLHGLISKFWFLAKYRGWTEAAKSLCAFCFVLYYDDMMTDADESSGSSTEKSQRNVGLA